MPVTERIAGSAGEMIVHHLHPQGVPVGTVFLAHGRNGAADQPHMRPVIEACLARSLAVVAPDICNSDANESAGSSADFTMAAHVADLRATIERTTAAASATGSPPPLLIGHSMGAYAALRIAAEAAAGAFGGVLAISPVISGRALIAARERMGAAAVAALRAELPGAFLEWPQHDLAPLAAAIDVPCAVIVGADDTLTTPADAATLAGWLRHLVWHDVVAGEHHCPLGEGYALSVGTALDRLLAHRGR